MIDPASLSGLELLLGAAEGRLPLASMAETMGIDGLAVEPGYARMTARADARHLNPMGGVHGGFAATLLDSVLGCAIHTMLEAGVRYATVDFAVKMLRPVPRDTDLVAEARASHVSRSLGTSEGTLKTADGRLLASATATCFISRS